MELVTGYTMQQIDKYTQDHLTPSLALMEEAGRQMAELILKQYTFSHVLILCGSKGNGGDGFVVGRYLLNANKQVDVYLTNNNFSNECQKNYELFKGNVVDSLDHLKQYDLIVDALIGVGLHSTLKENIINIINKVNATNIKIVSLDIPTGIDATTGISYGAFIHSDLCLTVEYPKTGLFLEDGLDSYQRLETIHIGIIKSDDTITLLEKNHFKDFYPLRKRNSNKGAFNKATLIASSKKYPGASLIAYNALSAFMMGVGYSYLYVEEDIISSYQLLHPELIVNAYPSIDGHIKYDEEFLNKIMAFSTSITIGMGLDVSLDAYNSIKYLLTHYEGTLIIDADGLNTLSTYGVDALIHHVGKVVLTPHIGEFLRLTKLSKTELFSNTLATTKEFASKYDIILVLKSAATIISNKDKTYISNEGNSGLAKAGSGDTLSGILAGVSAYFANKDLLEVIALGVYLFGLSATLASKEKELECLRPQDTVDHINDAIKYIKQ